jgi:DNA invertase Pin-like site-specific DNA recombinase
VSTDEQAADDRAGLPRQRDAIARVAAAHGLNVIRVVELAGVSGTVTREMPEIHGILKMVRTREIEGIVLADLDRLFRLKRPGDLAILDEFETAQATIWTDSGVYDYTNDNGTTLSILRGLFSGLELRAIKRRVQQAREKKRRNGELAGAKILLPTGVDYDAKSRIWNYSSAVVKVQEAYRLVDEECITNMSELGRRLNVQAATLRVWLRNPIYKGIRRIEWKRGEEYGRPRKVWLPGERRDRQKVRRAPAEIIELPVIDKPAVSVDRWERVQAILGDARLRWRRQRAAAGTEINLGSGLLTCGHCGGRLYASSGRNKKHPNRKGYYYCRQNHYLAKRKGSKCPQVNVQKPHLDEVLRRFVGGYLVQPDVLATLVTNLREPNEAPVDVTSELCELERRENRLLDAFEKGAMTAAKLKERTALIEAERSGLRSISERQRKREAEVEQGEDLLRRVIAGAFAFKRLSTPTDQKAALSQLFSEVKVTDCAITAVKPLPAFPSSVCQNATREGRGSSRRRT